MDEVPGCSRYPDVVSTQETQVFIGRTQSSMNTKETDALIGNTPSISTLETQVFTFSGQTPSPTSSSSSSNPGRRCKKKELLTNENCQVSFQQGTEMVRFDQDTERGLAEDDELNIKKEVVDDLVDEVFKPLLHRFEPKSFKLSLKEKLNYFYCVISLSLMVVGIVFTYFGIVCTINYFTYEVDIIRIGGEGGSMSEYPNYFAGPPALGLGIVTIVMGFSLVEMAGDWKSLVWTNFLQKKLQAANRYVMTKYTLYRNRRQNSAEFDHRSASESGYSYTQGTMTTGDL